MKWFLFLLLSMFFSDISIAGSCVAHADAFIGVLEFDITECEVKGDLEHKNGVLTGLFEVDLTKLDTGLSLRNKHMKEKYLNTDLHGKALFKLDPLKIGSTNFTGYLSLHGKTQKVSGKVIKSSPKNLKTTFDLDLTDYGIDIPEYKGITIAKLVKVSVDI